MTKIDVSQLYSHCTQETFEFETTEQLEDLSTIIGQERAHRAMQVGTGIEDHGYNLFVRGSAGVGKHRFVETFLAQRAEKLAVPMDICFVHCFESPQKPRVLRLSPGMGGVLRQDMKVLVDELKVTLPAAFDSDEYRASKRAIDDAMKEAHDLRFKAIQDQAEARGVRLVRASEGLIFAPIKDGKLVPPDEFKSLSVAEQEHFRNEADYFHGVLHEFLNEVSDWEKAGREQGRKLNLKTVAMITERIFNPLFEKFARETAVLRYLEEVQKDVYENYADFLKQAEGPGQLFQGFGDVASGGARFKRYEVNLITDNTQQKGAPVIYEDHPTYANLFGRIEHISQFGALTTDFTLIKGGALHRADGGYLILDAYRVLTQPYAWEGLKRVLKSGEMSLESLGQLLGIVSTQGLEPEELRIQLKVVLIGDSSLFHLLSIYDSDFQKLFKVLVDFEEEIPRSQASEQLLARMIGTIARQNRLRPLNREAVIRLVEEGVREAGDGEGISAKLEFFEELLREVDYCAREAGRNVAIADDVRQALNQKHFRESRYRDDLFREIGRGTLSIQLAGAVAGRVHGLAVVDAGGFRFGYPTVITARSRMGKGEVIDLQREAKLGGPIHSKGVMILAGYLSGKYVLDVPLTLAATVVFEQSYGMVEGDSASMAELLALLSSIADVPVLQKIALTGSLNQLGQVQAIGGVNEKIEGFFDLCSARGVGDGGVVIPQANVRHLMLKEELIGEVSGGRFNVHAVATIDEAIELLAQMSAFEFHLRVQNRLADWAEKARRFGSAEKESQKIKAVA